MDLFAKCFVHTALKARSSCDPVRTEHPSASSVAAEVHWSFAILTAVVASTADAPRGCTQRPVDAFCGDVVVNGI